MERVIVFANFQKSISNEKVSFFFFFAELFLLQPDVSKEMKQFRQNQYKLLFIYFNLNNFNEFIQQNTTMNFNYCFVLNNNRNKSRLNFT